MTLRIWNQIRPRFVMLIADMRFSNLYITAIILGLIGAAGGAFAGGFMADAACDGGLECLGVVFIVWD